MSVRSLDVPYAGMKSLGGPGSWGWPREPGGGEFYTRENVEAMVSS